MGNMPFDNTAIKLKRMKLTPVMSWKPNLLATWLFSQIRSRWLLQTLALGVGATASLMEIQHKSYKKLYNKILVPVLINGENNMKLPNPVSKFLKEELELSQQEHPNMWTGSTRCSLLMN